MSDRRPGRGAVADDLSVADVVESPPSLGRMVRRALLLRCPRCGTGGQFRHWVKRVEHCPGCGYTLSRDRDSFFGAYLLNLTVVFTALFGLLVLYLLSNAGDEPFPLGVVIVVGLAIALVLPVLFYPFSFTLWSVVDLQSEPLEVAEIAEAVDKVDAQRRRGPGDGDRPEPGVGA